MRTKKFIVGLLASLGLVVASQLGSMGNDSNLEVVSAIGIGDCSPCVAHMAHCMM